MDGVRESFMQSNPSPQQAEEDKKTEKDKKVTKTLQDNLLNQAHSIDAPLEKRAAPLEKMANRGVPTGRFFCTHTIKKRSLKKEVPTLTHHTIIEPKIGSAIEQQVRGKLGKKWLQECVESTNSKGANQDVKELILKNENCSILCETFGQNSKNIRALKNDIQTCQVRYDNLEKPTYSALKAEQDLLIKSEEAQNSFNSLLAEYEEIMANIARFQNCKIEVGIEVTEDEKKEVGAIIKKIDKLKVSVRSLQQSSGNLNKCTTLNDQLINTGDFSRHLNNIRRSVSELTKDNTEETIERKKEHQVKIGENYTKAITELNSIKEKLNKVNAYKQELKDNLIEAIPKYVQIENHIEEVFKKEKSGKELQDQFLGNIESALDSQEISTSIEAFKNLKIETEATINRIKAQAAVIENEAGKKNETDVIDKTKLDLLIEQIEFLESLLNLSEKKCTSSEGHNFIDCANQRKIIGDFVGKTKMEVRNNIGAFIGKQIKGLAQLRQSQNKQIDKKIEILEKKLPEIKTDLEKLLEARKKELGLAKKEKAKIIQAFLNEAVKINEDSISLEKILEFEVDNAQKLVKELLIEFQIHSQDRFSKLFTAHRNFVLRFNHLLCQLSPNVALEIKTNFKQFITDHTTQNKGTTLYRDMQGEHIDIASREQCQLIQAVVHKQFLLIFGKKITKKEFDQGNVKMQAAHVAPFSGLFSWQCDCLINSLFKSTLNLSSKEPQKQLEDDIGKFNHSIQTSETGMANFEEIQEELDLRGKNVQQKEAASVKELNTETQDFIFNALMFLSRISSLEMSETEHFPTWFNQKMDSLSEDQVSKTLEGGNNYKILLGNALMELMDENNLQEVPLVSTHSQIAYLTHTITILATKLGQLTAKEEEFTVLELLECHTIISIFGGINQLKIEELQQENEKINSLLTALEKKINAKMN